MTDVVIELGASPNATHLSTDIENLIKFEKELAEVTSNKIELINVK